MGISITLHYTDHINPVTFLFLLRYLTFYFQREYVSSEIFLGYLNIVLTHLVQGSTYTALSVGAASLFYGFVSYLNAMSQHFRHEIFKTERTIVELKQSYCNAVNLIIEMGEYVK